MIVTGVSTAEAHVPFHVSPCGICDDRMALEQEFVEALQPSPVSIILSMLHSASVKQNLGRWGTCL